MGGGALRQVFSVALRGAASLFLLGFGLWSTLALLYLARNGTLAATAAALTVPIALWALWRGRLWGFLPQALAGFLALALS